MSTFIIQVNGTAYGDSAAFHALKFTEAAIQAGHSILRVFFYQDGVFNSSSLLAPASDEFNIHQAWVELARQHRLELVNCVSAALRRGLLSAAEAREQGLAHWNVSEPVVMGGLGELVTGMVKADRLVCF
ncbi:sulfurtransferase complex subunit TusD [Shewanella cyperi]|uniref:sulfurtransferase complex subunit TusD n=1 Tax=Shewanella cyperi TaxID=2814292 RepID=UPI001A93E6EC|nr:sulfurtransferase complex subunit TusD [Shewanella cyperi]QSX42456.1 sulfurtransferase complex subunit TusD [Shewanella cyperi]